MEKCECYIHSLKQGETHVLGEATIIKRLGDNDYLAEYNGVKCHAIFNPFAGRYFVDDVYGVIPVSYTHLISANNATFFSPKLGKSNSSAAVSAAREDRLNFSKRAAKVI